MGQNLDDLQASATRNYEATNSVYQKLELDFTCAPFFSQAKKLLTIHGIAERSRHTAYTSRYSVQWGSKEHSRRRLAVRAAVQDSLGDMLLTNHFTAIQVSDGAP